MALSAADISTEEVLQSSERVSQKLSVGFGAQTKDRTLSSVGIEDILSVTVWEAMEMEQPTQPCVGVGMRCHQIS